MDERFRNKVICGDALEVMRSIPSGSFDCIVTSPPYNLRTTTSGGFHPAKEGRTRPYLADGYDGYTDDMPEDEYEAWQNECLNEMYRIVKDDGGAIFYNHRWRSQNSQWQMRERMFDGIPIRQVIIWHKGPGICGNYTCFMQAYEVIYLITKPGFRLLPNKQGYTNVWTIDKHCDVDWHPAPFPEEIPRRALDSTGAKSVLDPFAGSGTTLAVAKRMGVDYCGIDQSRQYCDRIEERLASVSASRSTLESYMG